MDRNGVVWTFGADGTLFLSVLLGSYPFMLEPYCSVGIPEPSCSAAMGTGRTTEHRGVDSGLLRLARSVCVASFPRLSGSRS
jgi:hypothetical protein